VTDSIRELVDAFEATIRAVILNERLRNPESTRSLQEAKDDLVRVLEPQQQAAPAVAPFVAPDDADRRRRREAAAGDARPRR
jgi:hypothetical protein